MMEKPLCGILSAANCSKHSLLIRVLFYHIAFSFATFSLFFAYPGTVTNLMVMLNPLLYQTESNPFPTPKIFQKFLFFEGSRTADYAVDFSRGRSVSKKRKHAGVKADLLQFRVCNFIETEKKSTHIWRPMIVGQVDFLVPDNFLIPCIHSHLEILDSLKQILFKIAFRNWRNR